MRPNFREQRKTLHSVKVVTARRMGFDVDIKRNIYTTDL
jgi:hypothetical protein